MSNGATLRGALGGLYAHNAAESKKSREEARVSKIIRESDRQFHQQVQPLQQVDSLHVTLLQINKDHSQQLKIIGRACKLSRDAAQYGHSHVMSHFHWLPRLIPFPGILFAKMERLSCPGRGRRCAAQTFSHALRLTVAKDCLIDRYDGRALLDMIPAPPARSCLPSHDDLLLERSANCRYNEYAVTSLQLFELRALSRPWCASLSFERLLLFAPDLTQRSGISAARSFVGRWLAHATR
jgi:hypothetical protein